MNNNVPKIDKNPKNKEKLEIQQYTFSDEESQRLLSGTSQQNDINYNYSSISNNYSSISNNYKKMNKKFKIEFYIVLIICFVITFILSFFIFTKFILPRMLDKKFKFFCAGWNLMNIDEICFISFGQISFGIIAIGQISFGIICIGQASFGFLVIFAQVSVGFIFTYMSQFTVSMVCYLTQAGICGLYCVKSSICVSPLNPIIRGKGNFITRGFKCCYYNCCPN